MNDEIFKDKNLNKNYELKDLSAFQNPSLYLVGFMGSGKTFIGERLAKTLLYDFIDADAFLEKKTGQSITEIFEKNGEHYFRELEHTILCELKEKHGCIISTGGGAPCFYDNMEIMNANGITVYLKVRPDIIVKRISEQRSHRPLLKNFEDDDEFLVFVKNKIAERGKFYSQARFIIDADGNIEEIINKIIKLVG